MTCDRPSLYSIVASALVLLASFMIAALMVSTTPRSGQDASPPGPSEAPSTGASPLVPAARDEGGGSLLADTGTPPFPVSGGISSTISGTATWYCSATSPCTRGYGPGDLVAAIDPTLGIPRGERVTVSSGGRSVRVAIVDVCACGGRRIIDLTSGAFRRLAPLSRGVIPVTIEVGASSATLPPTDTSADRAPGSIDGGQFVVLVVGASVAGVTAAYLTLRRPR